MAINYNNLPSNNNNTNPLPPPPSANNNSLKKIILILVAIVLTIIIVSFVVSMVFIQHTTKNMLNELGTGLTNPTIGNDKLISDNNDRGQAIINRNINPNSPYPYTKYVKKTCPDYLVNLNPYPNVPYLS